MNSRDVRSETSGCDVTVTRISLEAVLDDLPPQNALEVVTCNGHRTLFLRRCFFVAPVL